VGLEFTFWTVLRSGTIAAMRRRMLAASLLFFSVTATSGKAMPAVYQTTVIPEPDEDLATGCRYEITIPVPEQPVTTVWMVFERSRDMFRYYGESSVLAFARDHHWAMAYAFHCGAKSFTAPRERGDINPESARGQGRALLTALNQFSDVAHHPELKSVKVVLLGFSGAGALVARLSEYAPTRVAAVIAANAGHFDPYGIDRVSLSPDAARVPQLVIAGGQDRVSGVQRPYEYFRRHFDKGAPWTFVLQNETPHCCVENVRPLVLDWLVAVVVHRVSTGGVFGFIAKGPSDTVDCKEPFESASNAIWCRGGHDEWGTPNWLAVNASVRSGRTAPAGMVPSGWLPTRRFADRWKAFVSQMRHPIASLL
jgi:hypothetical protein